MLVVTVNQETLEYNEDNIGEVETAVRLLISPRYGGPETDRIWNQIKGWACDWEDHPPYTGWDEVVVAAAGKLRIVPANAVKTVEETRAALVLRLKRAWVKVSEDPTEAGQESDSLYAASTELRDVLEAIRLDKRLAAGLNRLVPTVFTVSDKYFGGDYDCHQNAARAVRGPLADMKFTEFLNSEHERSDLERYMAAEWDELVFSSRL